MAGLTARAFAEHITISPAPIRPRSGPAAPRSVASPRMMRNVWREEAIANGTLSPRAQTPRFAADGSSQLAEGAASDDANTSKLIARLSLMQTKQIQAAALASERGQRVAQLATAQQAAALQLDVLRNSHDGLSQAAASLEAKLRAESTRGDKFKRQYEKAMQRSQSAADAEAAAHADAAQARAELEKVRKELQSKDSAMLRSIEAAETMRRERDAAQLQAKTRLAERDSAKASLADLRTSYKELDEKRKNVQKQLEEARMSLLEEREVRLLKEKELSDAVENAASATSKLEAALKQLERERTQASDIVKRGLAAEQLLIDLEAKNAALQAQIDDEIQNSHFMASDRANAGRRLIGLRNDVGELAGSFLIAGDGTDPVRVHNEAIVAKLFEALAVSGGQLTRRQWAVEQLPTPKAPQKAATKADALAALKSAMAKPVSASVDETAATDAIDAAHSGVDRAAAPVPSLDESLGAEVAAAARAVAEAAASAEATARAADEGAKGVHSEKLNRYIVPPLGMASPRKLARLRQAQHDAGQLLLDSMARLELATAAQRKRLQQRLHEVAARLQYRGEAAAVRLDIVADLKNLAADDSPNLPVPPSLDVARAEGSMVAGGGVGKAIVLSEDTPGEWPPTTRPSTAQRPPAQVPNLQHMLPRRPATEQGPRRPTHQVPRSQQPTQASSGSDAINPSHSGYSSPNGTRTGGRSSPCQRPVTAPEVEWHWQRSSSPDRKHLF